MTSYLHKLIRYLAMAGLVVSAIIAKADPVEIQFTDRAGRPVECWVIRVEADGRKTSLGQTTNGKFTAVNGCADGCCLWFMPVESSTYFRDQSSCPVSIKRFPLRKIVGDDVQSLVAQLPPSTSTPQQAAKAALIANEIADRVSDKSVKAAYDTTAFLEAGKFLKVEQPIVYDESQRKVVPTKEFDDRVREFQSQKGLKRTRKLDYPTLTEASGTNAPQLLKGTSHQGF